MKDIVANRSLLRVRDKVRLQRLTFRENGLAYTVFLDVYYVASWIAEQSFDATQQIRAQKGIPGINSRTIQREIWEKWDWSDKSGDEWTISAGWKQSLVDQILVPHIPPQSGVLEIGPGAGRWTRWLIELASSYIGVDISSTCIAICEEEFGRRDGVQFHVGSGRDLEAVGSASVDRIWSFDTFVHIDREDAMHYSHEFARVLRPGGLGVIHHGDTGGYRGGWRSNLTTVDFHHMLKTAGLEVTETIREWQDPPTGQSFRVGLYDDVITSFRKPG